MRHAACVQPDKYLKLQPIAALLRAVFKDVQVRQRCARSNAILLGLGTGSLWQRQAGLEDSAQACQQGD